MKRFTTTLVAPVEKKPPDGPFGLDMSKIRCIRHTYEQPRKPVCCHIVKTRKYIPKYIPYVPKIEEPENCRRNIGSFSCMITDGKEIIVFCGNHYNQKIPITFKAYYESRGFNYNLQLSICANLWCYRNNVNPLDLTDIDHWIARIMIRELSHRDCTLFQQVIEIDVYTLSQKRSRDTHDDTHDDTYDDNCQQQKYVKSEVNDKSPFTYGQFTTFPKNITYNVVDKW